MSSGAILLAAVIAALAMPTIIIIRRVRAHRLGQLDRVVWCGCDGEGMAHIRGALGFACGPRAAVKVTAYPDRCRNGWSPWAHERGICCCPWEPQR